MQTPKPHAKTIAKYHMFLKSLAFYNVIQATELRIICREHKLNNMIYAQLISVGHISRIKRGLYQVNIKDPQPRDARILAESSISRRDNVNTTNDATSPANPQVITKAEIDRIFSDVLSAGPIPDISISEGRYSKIDAAISALEEEVAKQDVKIENAFKAIDKIEKSSIADRMILYALARKDHIRQNRLSIRKRLTLLWNKAISKLIINK